MLKHPSQVFAGLVVVAIIVLVCCRSDPRMARLGFRGRLGADPARLAKAVGCRSSTEVICSTASPRPWRTRSWSSWGRARTTLAAWHALAQGYSGHFTRGITA